MAFQAHGTGFADLKKNNLTGNLEIICLEEFDLCICN